MRVSPCVRACVGLVVAACCRYCPEVRHFQKQVSYYETDQVMAPTNSTYDVDETVYLFDCDWELRAYAPAGGLAGQITFTTDDDADADSDSDGIPDVDDSDSDASSVDVTRVLSTHIDGGGETTVKTRAKKTTFAWDACHGPPATKNEVIGTLQLCSNDSRVLFNRSSFADFAVQAAVYELAERQLQQWIEQDNVPVYWNVAPTCGSCAGPTVFNNCSGAPCPSFACVRACVRACGACMRVRSGVLPAFLLVVASACVRIASKGVCSIARCARGARGICGFVDRPAEVHCTPAIDRPTTFRRRR